MGKLGDREVSSAKMITKLTLLGTGTFFVSTDRSSSAYLLEVDDKKILIDCGPGTLMRLSQIGVELEDIDYVFITHLHADHTSDLFSFFMNFRLKDAFSKGKLSKFPQIFGPQGIDDFLLKLSKAYKLLSVKGWEKIKFLKANKKQKIGNISIESFNVKHIVFGLNANGLAYRFTVGNKVITFSGDCIKCSGIEKASKEADLFICDASYSKRKGSTAHMDTHDIGMISQKSSVKKVVLSHFYPQTDNIDLVKEVKEKFFGEVIRGKDLMAISL